MLQGPSFVPDAKFQGSTLAGWHVMGQADWSADNGELIGKGTAGSGWLVLDHSYQDTGFYAGFRCVGVCDTGVLIRATKTEGGMRRYLPFHQRHAAGWGEPDLDAEGNIVDREKLREAVGQIRFAPPGPIRSRLNRHKE